MKQDEFLDCIDLYGSDLYQWPADLQASAQASLAENPCYATLLQQRDTFDQDLAQSLSAIPTTGFEERITIAAFNAPRTEPKDTWQDVIDFLHQTFALRMTNPVWTLAGITALGVIIGLTLPVSETIAMAAQDTSLLENLSNAFYGMRTLI